MAVNDIRQHFPKQEHAFISHMEDMIRRCQDTGLNQLTEFLNPRQVTLVKNLCQRAGLNCFVSCESWPSEFGRCLIAPDYYQLMVSDFEMALLEIVYNPKFKQLTHPSIMGTFIGQLGIKRATFGDILIHQARVQVMVDRNLVDYMTSQITKIAGIGVTLKEVSFETLVAPRRDVVEKHLLVSSLRLDKVISSLYQLSRSEANKLIQSGAVKVNYAVIDYPELLLDNGDLVSVRGQGRFCFLAHQGFSKSGKHKIVIERIL